MSKALVIKGANFALNKVETINLSEPIPCTGISLSQNTINATQLGVAGTLVATVTPSDTTDIVTWVSSDESVATVVNGVVTITGVGTALITATCGEQIATCTISAKIVIDASTLEILHNKMMSVTTGRDYIGVSSASNTRIYCTTNNALNGYKAISRSESEYSNKYAIPLPKNATNILVIQAASSFGGGKIGLEDANTLTSFGLASDAKGAKAYLPLMSASFNNDKMSFDITNRDTNINSFMLQIYSTASDESQVDTGITIEIS